MTNEPPAGEHPHLVVMLEGWIDASGAAAAAMSTLESESGAAEIIAFDDDEYIDYRARRPTLEIRNGVTAAIKWESPRILRGVYAAGSPLWLLTGPEPDSRWHQFADTIVALAEQYGVRSMTGLGAYPFAAPHTRPPRVSVTSPSVDLIATLGYPVSSVDVPAGITAVLEERLHSAGIPASSIWAQVPHYVAAMSFPAASVALLDALTNVAGIEISARNLRREVAVQRERLDHLVASNDEHRSMVDRLERMHDDAAAESASEPLELRSGDELAAEFERFLRDNP